MRTIPVIVGPTAGGKSAIAVELALLDSREGGPAGEVISADSMQVYRGLDIGSAKPTMEERRGVPHHLIDIREPTEAFSLHDWLALAEQAVAAIRGRGGSPIVVGGTHLYVKAFLEGLADVPEADPELRGALEGLPPAELRQELERVDPVAAERIHPNDLKRTIRAIEVHRATGRPLSELQSQWDRARARADARLVMLDLSPEETSRRINARVRSMIELGLVDEARRLWRGGRLGPQAREALGYKQLVEHFEGRATLEEAVEQIKIETRRFAKNQRTWLRRLLASAKQAAEAGAAPAPLVIDVTGREPQESAEAIRESQRQGV